MSVDSKSFSYAMVEFVEKLSSKQKRVIWSVGDLLSFALAAFFTYLIFYQIVELNFVQIIVYISISYLVFIILCHLSLLDVRLNRYSGINEYIQLMGVTLLSALSASFSLSLIFHIFSWRFSIISYIITFILIMASRMLWQSMYYSRFKFHSNQNGKRKVVVVGAGDGGSIFMNNYHRNPMNLEILAILDKDPNKHGKIISGIKVLGDIDLIPELSDKFGKFEIIVAIPSIKPAEYEDILKLVNPLNIKLYKMPPVEDVLQGLYRPLRTTNKVNIADLLGRKEVVLDESKLRAEIEGKTIAITGAGGSIGSEISRQISRLGPRRVILIGHGENSIYQIYHELIKQQSMTDYVPVIADIQDYERILQILETEEPDILYHAAAHKHVPLMEYNPVEAFKNNILGTFNVAKAVDKAGVNKMVMISTDKAINPPNVMGATKRVAELIVTGFNQQSQSNYSAVRFGNVLGSRGSVIPVFEQQIQNGGPVTVTDFRMTRYFMTIPEASRLVIYSGAFAEGGEVFVLNMGDPVKILDLAKKLILLSGYTEEEIEIVESGIRPGEKLYEELLTNEETTSKQIDKDIFIGKVVTKPLEETKVFIQSLYNLPPQALKEKIIAFANQSAK